MKNVETNVKARRIVKSFNVVLFTLFLFIGGTAFTKENKEPGKPDLKDSLLNEKSGFKSFFSASHFDPAKPYIAQLNPKALPFVQRYIREEGADLEKMKIWGKPYFDLYEGILSKYGLPTELKYLSVIEFSLVSNSVSSAGAVGPWQIMAGEARRMGLRVGGRMDERTDFLKSTTAAARILRELHSQFKDWLLVVAAYNCGSGRIRRAIRESGTRNFWNLQAYLPAETRAHVKRFIGTHFIFEGNGGLTTMTAAEVLDFDTKVAAVAKQNSTGDDASEDSIIKVSGKYKAGVIAKNLGIDITIFNRLNPNFDRLVAMGQTYQMRLPADKVNLFTANKNVILNESIAQFLMS